MDDLSKELTVEMLPDNQWKQVAEEIGIENFCKMLKIVGGATLYIQIGRASGGERVFRMV